MLSIRIPSVRSIRNRDSEKGMRSRVQVKESCVDWETFLGDGTGRVVGIGRKRMVGNGGMGRMGGGEKRECRGGILMGKGVGRKRGGFVVPNQVVKIPRLALLITRGARASKSRL